MTLPLADLVPAHAVENAVLMVDAEPAGREPPFDDSTDGGAAAPALGITTATQVVRIVHALYERPTHVNSIRLARSYHLFQIGLAVATSAGTLGHDRARADA